MKVWRRPSIGQAGPLGGDFPVVTKEGHNILDVIFTSPIENLGKFCKCDACFNFQVINLSICAGPFH